jgi:hypothetical protein
VAGGTEHTDVHDYGDFQATPDGNFAVFASGIPFTGFPVHGNSEIYRYDAAGGSLDCISCASTGATATVSATLSHYGSNITDDGRVFFTTGEGLVLRDSNHKKDAYEWADGGAELISTGVSLEDSGLVTVSADGTDAFFYTHELLTAQDKNGQAMKIYDARVNGGYPYDAPPPPCQASDECHGPGTEAAPPPDIGTFKGIGGQFKPQSGRKAEKKCKRRRVKRKGRCVKTHQTKKRNRNHG